jgi:hypothetical protein
MRPIEAPARGAREGFAVVADEIGKLAVATSDNAKEISGQLERNTPTLKGASPLCGDPRRIGEVLTLIDRSGRTSTGERAMKNRIGHRRAGMQSERLDRLSQSILAAACEQQAS